MTSLLAQLAALDPALLESLVSSAEIDEFGNLKPAGTPRTCSLANWNTTCACAVNWIVLPPHGQGMPLLTGNWAFIAMAGMLIGLSIKRANHENPPAL